MFKITLNLKIKKGLLLAFIALFLNFIVNTEVYIDLFESDISIMYVLLLFFQISTSLFFIPIMIVSFIFFGIEVEATLYVKTLMYLLVFITYFSIGYYFQYKKEEKNKKIESPETLKE